MWDPLISESIDFCGWDPPVSALGASFSSLFSPVLHCQAQAHRWWISRTRLRWISPATTAADLAHVSEVSEKGGSLEKRGRIAGEEREDRWPRELVVADELVPRLGARSCLPPACCWRREGGSPALHAHRLPPVPPWVGQCSGGRGWQWGGRRRRSVVVEEKRKNQYLHN
jgi:hypothetical protein